MILRPATLALLLALSLQGAGLIWAGLFALRLLRQWNPASGSEGQIDLERRTWLASTLVGLSLVLSLPALALFVRDADALAPFFSGAMCAVGSLKVNAWGLPALVALLAGFFASVAWLVMNHLDAQGWDTPLTRAKYRLLLLLAPLAVAQATLLWLYYLNLKPEVITSCCGSLFGPAASGAAAELAALPARWAEPAYLAVLAPTLALALLASRQRNAQRFGPWLGLASALHFIVALAAVVAFIAPYIYQEPNHHCPFCLLQAEHGHAGWALYPPLFLGTAAGLGAGIAARVRAPSLAAAAPALSARLARWSALGTGLFALAAGLYVARSTLVLA